MNMSKGAIACAVLAATLTVMDVIVLRGYDIDAVWMWLQIPVVAMAWVAPWAWHRKRWVLAGVSLLTMLLGLWGYFYAPPLAAFVLAAIAFRMAVSNARAERSRTRSTP